MLSGSSTVVQRQSFGYDGAGRLNAAAYHVGSTLKLGYYYTYDGRNRRSEAYREDGTRWTYGYNNRGELTEAAQRLGSAYVAGRRFSYAYDNIGNRLSAKSGGTTSGTSQRTITYNTGVAGASANELNQYPAISNPSTFDVAGLADASSTLSADLGGGTAATITTKQPATGMARFHREMTATSSSSTAPRQETVRVYEGGVLKKSGALRLPPVNQSPTYDADGNLLSDGTWTYTWDAENRLIAVAQNVMPIASYVAVATLYKYEYAYDYRHRRIAKKVYTRPNTSSGWTQQPGEKYVYHDWNLSVRLTFPLSGAGSVMSRYWWGPDVSGTMEGAGGVGGLLLASESGTRLFCAYDGNGNLVAANNGSNATPAAVYDYDPFGNELRRVSRAGTTFADQLPFRFSTKFTENQTGLLYYGYRYYSPQHGRWLSRDPIGERGGVNLYGFVENDAGNRLDYMGLFININISKNKSYTQQDYQDMGEFKEELEKKLKELKKCCEEKKEEIGHLGLCKAIFSPEQYDINIHPPSDPNDRSRRHETVSGGPAAIKGSPAKGSVNYPVPPNGSSYSYPTESGSAPQTIEGDLAHELEHAATPGGQDPTPSQKPGFPNKAEEAAVEAENLMRIHCCPDKTQRTRHSF